MGKNKYIETPERMWELFQAYKKDVKDNPRKINVFGGKDFDKRDNELERPLTMAGFDCFVMDDEGIRSSGVEQYFSNTEDRYTDYIGICTRIRNVIRQDQIEGGMVGQYNNSITQRLNGLTDKKEIEHKGELNIPNVPDIGDRK
jgi:hypothetical protein